MFFFSQFVLSTVMKQIILIHNSYICSLLYCVISSNNEVIPDTCFHMYFTILQEHIDQGRMLVDIIADLPSEFLERSEHGSTGHTVQAYADFIAAFLEQIR